MHGVANHNNCVDQASSHKGPPAELWMLNLLLQKISSTLDAEPRVEWRGRQQVKILKAGIRVAQWCPHVLSPLCHPNQCTSHVLKIHIHKGHLLQVLSPIAQGQQNQVNLHNFYRATWHSKKPDTHQKTWGSGKAWSGGRKEEFQNLLKFR